VLFTLDTNCIIDLELGTEFAPPIRDLVAAHHEGTADIAIPSIAGSELQKDGTYLPNFDLFLARLAAVGLSGLPLVQPIAYWNISFYGHGYWADEAMVDLERRIHSVLHPEIEFAYGDFCRARGFDLKPDRPHRLWRNAKCDTQALWSHIYHKRHCFVTRDRNFLKETKLPALTALGAGRILVPKDAVLLIKPAA
jgi:hypothetical protein